MAANAQTGAAGAALPTPLGVTITDAQGRAVTGAAVSWSTNDGSVSPGTASTDASGRAQAVWTLAPKLGQQSATATVGTLSASFTATATLPTTASLLRVAGDAQSDTATAVLRDTLVVQVRLPAGQAIPGVPVTWSVAAGGGSVVALTAVTDADGRVRAVWTLGTTAGEQRVNVTAPELQSVSFTATARAGAAHAIVITPDSATLDMWGDTARFTASVRDRHGNASTTAITWSSADTMIARVSSTGVVTSHRAGRAAITASAGNASTTRTAVVALQRNTRCQPLPPRVGAVTGMPSFDMVILENLHVPAWPGSRSIAADYDGDGDEDIVRLEYSYPGHTPYSGTVTVFRNDAGVLRNATAEVMTGTVIPDHPRDFEVRDFTGDGVPDIYVAQHGFDATPFPGAPNLLLTRQGAQLRNVAPTAFAPYVTTSFTHGTSAADVDCDGDLDLIELNLTGTAPNYLMLNDGAGRFTAAPLSSFPIGNLNAQRWQEAEFVDLENDGDPDIFLGARSGPGWNEDAILVNDGFGRFRLASVIRLPAPRYTAAHAINNAKAADFDGDGLQDLILFEIPEPFSTRSAIRLWLNRNGSFIDASQQWGIVAECSGEVIEPLHVVEINHDSWPDVLIPNGCGEYGAGVLVNRGDRFEFFGYDRVASFLRVDPATPIDVDRDGYPDLFFGERGGNPVLLRNRR